LISKKWGSTVQGSTTTAEAVGASVVEVKFAIANPIAAPRTSPAARIAIPLTENPLAFGIPSYATVLVSNIRHLLVFVVPLSWLSGDVSLPK
jgi:hypothetical protein